LTRAQRARRIAIEARLHPNSASNLLRITVSFGVPELTSRNRGEIEAGSEESESENKVARHPSNSPIGARKTLTCARSVFLGELTFLDLSTRKTAASQRTKSGLAAILFPRFGPVLV
jgi:hypothetical protein